MMVSLSAHTLLIFERSVANTESHHARNIGVISSLLCVAHCELSL